MFLGAVFGGVPFSLAVLSKVFFCTGTALHSCFSRNVLKLNASKFSNFLEKCSSEFLNNFGMPISRANFLILLQCLIKLAVLSVASNINNTTTSMNHDHEHFH